MDKLKIISLQTSWQIFGKIITSLSSIVLLSLISRNYGEDGTGMITLVITYLGFFILLTDFGINVHLLPQFLSNQITKVWQQLLGFRLVLAVMWMMVALIGAWIIPIYPGDKSGFIAAAAIGVVVILHTALFTTSAVVFQSKFRYDLPAVASIIGSAATLLLVYLLVINTVRTPLLLIGYAAGWLLTATTGLLMAKSYVTNWLPKFDFNFIRQVISQSWPVSLTMVLNLVYFRLDALVLASLQPLAQVGIYNLAYQIFQTALVIPSFIMNSYYPLMLKQAEKNQKHFFTEITKSLGLMVGLGMIGLGTTLVLARWVVELITGGVGFTESAEVLKILAISFPAFFATSVLMWSLITLHKYKTMLAIYLAGLFFNLAFNLIMIPRYSFWAAAWVTVVGEYLILVLQLLILVKLKNEINHSH